MRLRRRQPPPAPAWPPSCGYDASAWPRHPLPQRLPPVLRQLLQRLPAPRQMLSRPPLRQPSRRSCHDRANGGVSALPRRHHRRHRCRHHHPNWQPRRRLPARHHLPAAHSRHRQKHPRPPRHCHRHGGAGAGRHGGHACDASAARHRPRQSLRPRPQPRLRPPRRNPPPRPWAPARQACPACAASCPASRYARPHAR